MCSLARVRVLICRHTIISFMSLVSLFGRIPLLWPSWHNISPSWPRTRGCQLKTTDASGHSLLPRAAENAQQEHKQVDEVQVQLQRANDGQPSCTGIILCLLAHALDLLSVVSRQSDEDRDAKVCEHPIKS